MAIRQFFKIIFFSIRGNVLKAEFINTTFGLITVIMNRIQRDHQYKIIY